jgi:hypothetical protein
MRSRLDDLPVFETLQGTVPAADYNLVQIALKRLGDPLRFDLPRLRTLDLILEKDAWIVVDCALNDMPVLAWLDFRTEHRANLHEPIDCERRTYHIHAPIIIDKVIEAMHLILGEQLNAISPTEHDSISQLKRPP